MNDLLVKIKRIQKALENAEREITEVLSEQPEQSSEIQDILEYLDTVLHPIISPDHWNVYSELHDMISMLPSTQHEITDEQAIDHLQSTGWMQNHDKQMYEMGLKENLADDSGGYDSLIPSAQPDIARDIATIIENEQDMRVVLKNEHTETHSCDSERTETHGWIPVTEALPNDGVEVWVTIKGHDVIRCEEGKTLEQAIDRINKIRWVTRGYWSDEEHGWNDPSFGCPLMVKPIAWMPMEVPEPWRGGQDEQA